MSLPDDLPAVVGDRIQLQQVILNLLRNAADAMSTIDDRPRELLIRTERDEGNQVRLSVKDSGVGFNAASRGQDLRSVLYHQNRRHGNRTLHQSLHY